MTFSIFLALIHLIYTVNWYNNVHIINNVKISSFSSGNSKAFASEFLENTEYMFPQYYTHRTSKYTSSEGHNSIEPLLRIF